MKRSLQSNLSWRPVSHQPSPRTRPAPPTRPASLVVNYGLDADGERLMLGLKHKVPGVVRNFDSSIFKFEDVSRQKDFSRIDPMETRIISAPHPEAVAINSGRPCGKFAGFLVDQLCADRAKPIDIELFQVRSNVARRATRRKNGQQGACWSVGGLFKKYPASTVIDRRQVGPSGLRSCGQRAM
jgi:hypothetical protein